MLNAIYGCRPDDLAWKNSQLTVEAVLLFPRTVTSARCKVRAHALVAHHATLDRRTLMFDRGVILVSLANLPLLQIKNKNLRDICTICNGKDRISLIEFTDVGNSNRPQFPEYGPSLVVSSYTLHCCSNVSLAQPPWLDGALSRTLI
jgi:hypothetical protein